MELVKLQSDLFIPVNFEEDHRYFVDEKGETEYTGITTILRVMAKPALIQWAANEACKYITSQIEFDAGELAADFVDNRLTKWIEEARTAHTKKKEAAGTHGTNMHALVERYIKECLTQSEGVPREHNSLSPIKKFSDWATENVDRFLFAERPVHSRSLFLAGTIDFGAVMKDGKRVVGDLKTGSGIYYEAILQTEFYQVLAEEEGDTPYTGSVIVRLGKDGKFETQERARNELDRQAALGLLAAYRGNASYVKPK